MPVDSYKRCSTASWNWWTCRRYGWSKRHQSTRTHLFDQHSKNVLVHCSSHKPVNPLLIVICCYRSTLCPRKTRHALVTIISSNLNRFSKHFHCCKACYMSEAPKPYIQEGHLHLHFSSVGVRWCTGLEKLKMLGGKLLTFLTTIVVISLLSSYCICF